MNKHTRIWQLQDAKAKLSEVIRLAETEGPQMITVNGKERVTIQAVHTPAQSKRLPTGKDFVAALRGGPKFDLNIPRRPKGGRFREFEL